VQAEQQQGELKHHREAFYDEVEMPLLEFTQLTLSVPVLIGTRAPTVPEISVDPLIAKHCEKRCEE